MPRAWPSIVALALVAGCGRIGFAAYDGGDGAPDGGVPSAGSPYRGARIFLETFEDGTYDARGWFDGVGGAVGPPSPAAGSGRSFECVFASGAQHCTMSDPGRHALPAIDSIYVSYWVRYEVGNAPTRELWLFTTEDDELVAGAESRLGVTFGAGAERVGDITSQDGVSVDRGCVELTDGTTVGCAGGALADYPFSEMRSVCGCNGRSTAVDAWECSDSGPAYWSSCRWASSSPIVDGSWHFVEVFLRMSSVVAGRGMADGSMRYWIDGELRIDRDDVLLRTGAFPTLAFDQIMLRPFRFAGLDFEETLWIDDLEVAVGRMP